MNRALQEPEVSSGQGKFHPHIAVRMCVCVKVAEQGLGKQQRTVLSSCGLS